MDKQFDELSKSLAEEGASRREALRKFGIGLAGVLLASLGLGSRAAGTGGSAMCCSYVCHSDETSRKEQLILCNADGSACLQRLDLTPLVCFLQHSHQATDCSHCS